MPERLELRENERVSALRLFARTPTMGGDWGDQTTTYHLPADAKAEITEFGVLVRDTAAATLHPWSRIVEVQIRYVHGPEPEPPPPPRDPRRSSP